MPIASFATTQVRKVELQGAVTEAANAHPPQVRASGPGEWTTPGFEWERPVLPPELNPAPALPSVHQPLETQPWERWTDVWQPATEPATSPALPSPVPGEEVAEGGFEASTVSPPLPAPVEGPPPPAPVEGPPPAPEVPEVREDPGPADAGDEDSSIAADARAFDTGEWWIVDNPPVAEADPHQWWIVDDSAEATGGTQAPGPDPGDGASALETSQPNEPEDEATSRRAGRRPRDRREPEAQHGWASSLAPKRGRSGPGDKASVSHQLRARRVWAMEETDPVEEEAEAPPPAATQAPAGNVVQFPRENHAEAVADDIAPEARAQETPVSAIASGGRVGPEAVGRERKPSRGAAQEAMASETVAPERSPPKSVTPEVGLEGSGTSEQESVSPGLKDLLDVAAVQAAVDAIVDAAVRGTSTGPDDDWRDP